MTARPATIMPAVPFASKADRERASSVMRPIMTERVGMRQIAKDDDAPHGCMWQIAQSRSGRGRGEGHTFVVYGAKLLARSRHMCFDVVEALSEALR